MDYEELAKLIKSNSSYKQTEDSDFAELYELVRNSILSFLIKKGYSIEGAEELYKDIEER